MLVARALEVTLAIASFIGSRRHISAPQQRRVGKVTLIAYFNTATYHLPRYCYSRAGYREISEHHTNRRTPSTHAVSQEPSLLHRIHILLLSDCQPPLLRPQFSPLRIYPLIQAHTHRIHLVDRTIKVSLEVPVRAEGLLDVACASVLGV